jgi:hypothetical protein
MDRLQQTMALLATTFGLFLLLLPQVQCQTAGTYVIIGVLGLSCVPIMCECMYVCAYEGAVLLLLSFFCKDCSCRLCSIGKLCIVGNEVERTFGLQKEGGESQGFLIYLTLAHHVCILQFWMQVLAMEWIVSKDSVLYCPITPTLPIFCLHTSASAILDGQLWSHWLQDSHFCLLCHAQFPIVSSFFSLNWKFCRPSPCMTERLGFADVFCNLLACLSNKNLRYKAKLFEIYKRMGLWGRKHSSIQQLLCSDSG